MDEMAMRRAIELKRDGAELSPEDWSGIVAAFMDDRIDEAQMAALCMACVWRGMSLEEAHALTQAMVASGDVLHFDGDDVVDKHSSGGVSDIVSLVAVPLAAACGAHVAKLSGRALGHTGGTIDKLESIPGFNANLSTDAFIAQVRRIGCAIAAQTSALVPADKRMYALRDRTATVPSMGLIAASIVSKKIAGGAHAFVFDVKTGRAAFMQKPEAAAELARRLVEISTRFGRRATAFVTDMNEPLGHSIGTGLEIVEARNFLSRNAADSVTLSLSKGRVYNLVLPIVAAMLAAAGIDDGESRARSALASGAAYEKFVEMIEAQGATRATLESMEPLPNPQVVRAQQSGYLHGIDVIRLGNLGRELAARNSLAGLRVAVRIGDRIEKNAALAYVHTPDAVTLDLAGAFELSNQHPPSRPLIYPSP
jgi:pyrimidine-nucleoside phosphorylase